MDSGEASATCCDSKRVSAGREVKQHRRKRVSQDTYLGKPPRLEIMVDIQGRSRTRRNVKDASGQKGYKGYGRRDGLTTSHNHVEGKSGVPNRSSVVQSTRAAGTMTRCQQ